MTRRFPTPIAHPGDCESSSHIPFIAGHCEQSRGRGHISNHPSPRRCGDPGRVCRALSAESAGKRPVDAAHGQGTLTRGRAEINGSVLIEWRTITRRLAFYIDLRQFWCKFTGVFWFHRGDDPGRDRRTVSAWNDDPKTRCIQR